MLCSQNCSKCSPKTVHKNLFDFLIIFSQKKSTRALHAQKLDTRYNCGVSSPPNKILKLSKRPKWLSARAEIERVLNKLSFHSNDTVFIVILLCTCLHARSVSRWQTLENLQDNRKRFQVKSSRRTSLQLPFVVHPLAFNTHYYLSLNIVLRHELITTLKLRGARFSWVEPQFMHDFPKS